MIPTFNWNETRADFAWKAYQALLFTERDNPDLRENPAWNALRADAYEDFMLAFEKVDG